MKQEEWLINNDMDFLIFNSSFMITKLRFRVILCRNKGGTPLKNGVLLGSAMIGAVAAGYYDSCESAQVTFYQND